MSKTKASNSELPEKIFSGIYKHPFIAAALACMLVLLLPTRFTTISNTLSVSFLIALLGACGAYFSYRIYSGDKAVRHAAAIGCSGLLCAFLFFYQVFVQGAYGIVLMNGGLAVCVGAFLYLLASDKLSVRSVIILLFAAGFVMRLSYVVSVDISIVQHDVYYLGNGSGHSGYIEYLYANGHLPDFDVRKVDQFYHPPLHHILAALWMRIQTIMGVEYELAYQNIRVLTLFYSTASLIISYKIFRRLGISKVGLIVATAVVAFCPTFYWMSGSVNNDILSITLMLGAILNTLCWYKSRSIKRILCIALCVGFGMMAKLSAWMVAPAIAVVFIYVLFESRKSFVKYLVQYVAFLAVCAPIGLFWSVRNFIRWGVPFTFVQRLSEKSSQYIGNIPISTRIFDLSPHQFADVAPQFTMFKGSYNEYNPLVALFKTSAFDEYLAVRHYPTIAGFSHVLFWSSVVLGVLGFAAMIFMFIRKNSKMDVVQKSLIGVFYFTLLGMYYYFCMDYPHVCTMNIRYAVPLIVIGALSIGYLASELLKMKKKWSGICLGAICAVIGIYAVSGYAVFSICAKP